MARRLRREGVEKAVASGEVLGPLRRVEGLGRFDFLECGGYYCRFRKGDQGDLREHLGGDQFADLGGIEVKNVTYPREGVVRLEVSRKRKNRPEVGRDHFLYPTGSSFLDQRMQSVVRAATEMTRPDPVGLARLGAPSASADRLNHDQAEALRYLAAAPVDGCVQGPPGTGKTYLLRAVVEGAVQAGLSVGLAAFTHAAIDNAFSRLAKLRDSQSFVRVGAKIRVREELYDPDWLKPRRATSFGALSCRPRVVAATTHSWVLSESPIVDLLVIDEAAQVPSYMLLSLLAKARHVICLGDHRQLPPVLKGKHPGIGATDLFTSLLDSTTPMLKTQYRMNKVVQGWSAARYYDGRLVPDDSVRDRDLLRDPSGLSPALGASPVQLRLHAEPGEAQSNIGEAGLAADLAIRLRTEGGLPSEQIGVIAPHRMQNGAICRKLQERLGAEVASAIQVDTVERFQGQEREAIILSFGSNGQGAPDDDRGADFLGDPRRINVAVTRARSRFYCLASNELQRAAVMRSSKGADEIREFIAWCENPLPAGGKGSASDPHVSWWSRYRAG